jgi:hypothetical protein
MLSAFPIAPNIGKSLADASWIDLVDPTPTETAAFEEAFGLRVPTQEELSEIETTSRLRVEHGALSNGSRKLHLGLPRPNGALAASLLAGRYELLVGTARGAARMPDVRRARR